MMILPKKEKSQKKINSKKYNYNYIHINTFLKKDVKKKSKTPLKFHKFHSEIELKMFNDKNLNKLKAIKGKNTIDKIGDKKVDTFTNNHNEIFPFVKSDTSETDSTLLNIVSENKNL